MLVGLSQAWAGSCACVITSLKPVDTSLGFQKVRLCAAHEEGYIHVKERAAWSFPKANALAVAPLMGTGLGTTIPIWTRSGPEVSMGVRLQCRCWVMGT